MPDWPEAFLGRGNIKSLRHDSVGALGDYARAIDLNPDYAEAHLNAGSAKLDTGDLDGVLATVDKSLVLKPELKTNAVPILTRLGDRYYERHEFPKALEAFRRVSALAPDDELLPARIWLARARLGQIDDANRELVAYRDGVAGTRPRPTGWDLQICDFLLSRASEETLFESAEVVGGRTAAREHCLANFLVANKRLLSGDAEGARSYFEKCLGTEKKDFYGYAGAEAELAFLKAAAKAAN
jgi:tetratricopeptide (TPR) repeat protein